MKLIEKESIKHGTKEINFAIYDHSRSSLIIAFEAHWHPEFEINYVYQGTISFFMGGRNYTLHEDELLFVNKNQIHSCSDATNDNRHYVSIVFGEDFVFSNQNDPLYQKYFYPLYQKNFCFPPVITEETPGGKEILNCVRDFLSIYYQQTFSYEIFLRSKLLRFFHIALSNDIFIKADYRETVVNPIVYQAILTIRQNYKNPLSIHDLADTCHITPSYFCRLFKASVGKSPKAYLLDCRISNAILRLSQTEDSIHAVSDACGFDDVNYFARCFKQRTGLSPTEYRKRNQAHTTPRNDVH